MATVCRFYTCQQVNTGVWSTHRWFLGNTLYKIFIPFYFIKNSGKSKQVPTHTKRNRKEITPPPLFSTSAAYRYTIPVHAMYISWVELNVYFGAMGIKTCTRKFCTCEYWFADETILPFHSYKESRAWAWILSVVTCERTFMSQNITMWRGLASQNEFINLIKCKYNHL